MKVEGKFGCIRSVSVKLLNQHDITKTKGGSYVSHNHNQEIYIYILYTKLDPNNKDATRCTGERDIAFL